MAKNSFLETDVFQNMSNAERVLVDKYSAKIAADLHKFFSADTQSLGEEPNQPISREFEAFLILQSLRNPDKLSAAVRWFTEAANLQVKRKDRDELLQEAFEYERKDALSSLQELQKDTLRFEQFRTSFEVVEVDSGSASIDFPSARFTLVPELSLMMRDSQIAMGEIATKLSRAEHLVVENAVLDNERTTREQLQESVGNIADEKLAEELLSWRDVITQIQAKVSGAANG